MFDLNVAIKATIQDFQQWKKEFTAYDITTYLRQEFPIEEIVHSEVRQIVHDTLYGDEKYTRNFDENIGAFKYTPSTYQIIKQPIIKANSTLLTVKSGYRNRINLSRKITFLIGLSAGDNISMYVNPSKDSIYVFDSHKDYSYFFTKHHFCGHYRITSDKNVRIPNVGNYTSYNIIPHNIPKYLELRGQ
jgi:hypothetical protein